MLALNFFLLFSHCSEKYKYLIINNFLSLIFINLIKIL